MSKGCSNSPHRQLCSSIVAAALLWCTAFVAFAEPPPKDPEEEVITDGWIDGLQLGVENTVDATARWFDRFFGDGRVFDDGYDSQGRLSVGPEWSAFDGWKVRSRFRAEFRLPHAEERFSAIIGRGSFSDITTGDDTTRRGSVIRASDEDTEWILGLGFDPHRGETSRFSISGGIRGGLRADPYLQGRYLWQRRLSETAQLRTRSSLFWRDSDGFGFNQRFDHESSMSEEWLSRVSLDLTRAERIEGIRWRSTGSTYHLYEDERAIAGEIWVQGETKRAVSLTDTGFRLIHRSSFKREWLFLELWGGIHWPREEPEQVRKPRWLFGIEIEMWYGG
ncbi:MAG: hypothetical protein JJU10_00910 [Idiomarina sp.]|nr:hypothetical protein [Idiomarina sp.]